ncbi:hypothetical protein C6W89_04120 [Halomonas sp. SYSU XM8]|nr:hypothetical protein [Halomonas litopenaei]PTL93071.1 hypothetical protein C6W89_04120 [Halomonas sp. SYSU XM8]
MSIKPAGGVSWMIGNGETAAQTLHSGCVWSGVSLWSAIQGPAQSSMATSVGPARLASTTSMIVSTIGTMARRLMQLPSSVRAVGFINLPFWR